MLGTRGSTGERRTTIVSAFLGPADHPDVVRVTEGWELSCAIRMMGFDMVLLRPGWPESQPVLPMADALAGLLMTLLPLDAGLSPSQQTSPRARDDE